MGTQIYRKISSICENKISLICIKTLINHLFVSIFFFLLCKNDQFANVKYSNSSVYLEEINKLYKISLLVFTFIVF